jgi:hypothetical protein
MQRSKPFAYRSPSYVPQSESSLFPFLSVCSVATGLTHAP